MWESCRCQLGFLKHSTHVALLNPTNSVPVILFKNSIICKSIIFTDGLVRRPNQQVKMNKKLGLSKDFIYIVEPLGLVWMSLWTEEEKLSVIGLVCKDSVSPPHLQMAVFEYFDNIVLWQILGGRWSMVVKWCFHESMSQCAHCGLGAVYGCACISAIITKVYSYQQINLWPLNCSHWGVKSLLPLLWLMHKVKGHSHWMLIQI